MVEAATSLAILKGHGNSTGAPWRRPLAADRGAEPPTIPARVAALTGLARRRTALRALPVK